MRALCSWRFIIRASFAASRVPRRRRRRCHVPNASSTVAATVISTERLPRESPLLGCSLGRAAASANRSKTTRGPRCDFPAAWPSPTGSSDRAARSGVANRSGARRETRAADELLPMTRERFAVVVDSVRTGAEPEAFVESTPPGALDRREIGRVAARLTSGRVDGFPECRAAAAPGRDTCRGSSSETDCVGASASTTSVGGAAITGSATGGRLDRYRWCDYRRRRRRLPHRQQDERVDVAVRVAGDANAEMDVWLRA